MDGETNESRNVRIARALGYTVRGYPVLQQVPKYATTDYELLTPDGKSVKFGLRNEAEAWQHAPDFVDSCDASLAAIDPRRDVIFESDYNGTMQACWIEPLTINEDSYRGEGATRAEALVAALEAMLMAKQEAGGDAT